MSNPTSSFGWQMPTSSDLVTDLPADFEVFGQAVDTSLADLKGGTTGQVLSKTSNTDMDFTWVAQDDSNAIQNAIVDAKGDLIAATAADTPARLAVGTNGQVLTADSTASTGLAWTTPTAGMTNPLTTTGDTIYSSSGSTPARLGIGSTGNVLTVAGGVPTWAAPASPTATLTQIATGTLSGTSLSLTGLSSYDQLYLVIYGTTWSGGNSYDRIRLNATANNYAGSVWGTWGRATYNGAAVPYGSAQNSFSSIAPNATVGGVIPTGTNSECSQLTLSLTNCKATGRTSYDCYQSVFDGTYYWVGGQKGINNVASAISSINYETNNGYTFTAGTYILWGA